MKNYFYKIKFSFLCTPIDIVYLFFNFIGDGGGPFFCVRVFWRQMPVYTLLMVYSQKKTVDEKSVTFCEQPVQNNLRTLKRPMSRLRIFPSMRDKNVFDKNYYTLSQ